MNQSMDRSGDLALRYSEMGGLPIDHSEEPIRLFRSDFLEFFTHITPAAVTAIWLPVAALLLFRAYQAAGGGPLLHIPLAILLGVLLWTLAEYLLHRFVFHFHPQSNRLKRLVFLFHGIHHAQPTCKTRLVMPPAVSVPGGILFYALFRWVTALLGAPQWADPLAAGFTLGYLAYDLTHYATHHFPMRWGVLKAIKRHHMQHHYKTPAQRFGVSSPLWDEVFGTQPRA